MALQTLPAFVQVRSICRGHNIAVHSNHRVYSITSKAQPRLGLIASVGNTSNRRYSELGATPHPRAKNSGRRAVFFKQGDLKLNGSPTMRDHAILYTTKMNIWLNTSAPDSTLAEGVIFGATMKPFRRHKCHPNSQSTLFQSFDMGAL